MRCRMKTEKASWACTKNWGVQAHREENDEEGKGKYVKDEKHEFEAKFSNGYALTMNYDRRHWGVLV